MLQFKNFSKRYDGRLIISVPDLTLTSGTYWIRGENGSGKSTLFKSLAGMIPYEGSITLDQTLDIQRHPIECRRRIHFAEAEPVFPGFMTAFDLIQFMATTRGAASGQVDNIVERFGIDRFLRQRCETFSSGMLKKVSLAMAFIGRPEVLILDEPLITLDDQARSALVQLTLDTQRDHNMVTLVSSHQTAELPTLAIKTTYRIVDQTLVAE